jgi:uncharacterized protein
MIALLAFLAAIAQTIVVAAPNEKLNLEVADTFNTREYGLMNRTHLEPHSGMIFVFAGNGSQTFWMKNTLMPLDMIWVRANGTIDTVASDVPASTPQAPGEQTTRRGYGKYVIELAAGEARRAGLHSGLHLTIPNMEPRDS